LGSSAGVFSAIFSYVIVAVSFFLSKWVGKCLYNYVRGTYINWLEGLFFLKFARQYDNRKENQKIGQSTLANIDTLDNHIWYIRFVYEKKIFQTKLEWDNL
jgi:putative Ca2+/H+ antiporter (TMEM165/GDT1 family)